MTLIEIAVLRENREHLKYLGNVYCVMTNHIKDQDMQTNHKLNIVATSV